MSNSNMPGPYVDGISALCEQIDSFKFSLQPMSIGTVTEISDGIARISGLRDLMIGEMIEFGKTKQIFEKPEKKSTEDYITGRFG